jgi:hypothetical protein
MKKLKIFPPAPGNLNKDDFALDVAQVSREVG